MKNPTKGQSLFFQEWLLRRSIAVRQSDVWPKVKP